MVCVTTTTMVLESVRTMELVGATKTMMACVTSTTLAGFTTM
jgi:hypothetical protein